MPVSIVHNAINDTNGILCLLSNRFHPMRPYFASMQPYPLMMPMISRLFVDYNMTYTKRMHNKSAYIICKLIDYLLNLHIMLQEQQHKDCM